MPRIARDHAALMDSVYRNQRYIYDFTRKYYLFGRDRLIAGLAAQPRQSVVEIGCGTARNLIKMARLYPKTLFYGLDASEEMLVTARQAVAREGLNEHIHLVHGLAEDLQPAAFDRGEPFDAAIFSYSLSMIPDWKQALKAASFSIGANGKMHIVDFGDLTGLGFVAAAVLETWLRLFHVSPRTEILRGLEAVADKNATEGSELTLLPARYAFLWRSEGKSIQHLML